MRPLGVLLPDDAPEWGDRMDAPRLALAKWITDPANPLTARVMVNRIWQHHFGAGLVATPNDFGRMGTPSEPSGTARLAGQPVRRGRLPHEAAAPADPAEQHVSAGVSADAPPTRREGSRQPAAVAVSRGGGSVPRNCAMRCWR